MKQSKKALNRLAKRIKDFKESTSKPGDGLLLHQPGSQKLKK